MPHLSLLCVFFKLANCKGPRFSVVHQLLFEFSGCCYSFFIEFLFDIFFRNLLFHCCYFNAGNMCYWISALQLFLEALTPILHLYGSESCNILSFPSRYRFENSIIIILKSITLYSILLFLVFNLVFSSLVYLLQYFPLLS